MIILVNSAGVKVWTMEIEEKLNSKVYEEDIKVFASLDYAKQVKDYPKPFFSKYYIVYIYAEEGQITPRNFEREDVVYVIITKGIDFYTKIKETLKIDLEFNTYLCKKEIIEKYIMKRLPDIDYKDVKDAVNKLGSKRGNLEEVISKLEEGKRIRDYKTITVDKLLTQVLVGQVKKPAYKMVYRYKYNPKFLMRLIDDKLDEMIEFKMEYNKGKINALNVYTNYKDYKMSINKCRIYVRLSELVNLERMLFLRSIIEKESKNRIENYFTLIKFLQS